MGGKGGGGLRLERAECIVYLNPGQMEHALISLKHKIYACFCVPMLTGGKKHCMSSSNSMYHFDSHLVSMHCVERINFSLTSRESHVYDQFIP